MTLLIDNYDSFSYNLYQLVGSIDPDIRVVRNDAVSVEDIRAMKPGALILSPGPGRPSCAGICEEAVLGLAGELPILGVCLGHQAICEAFGGEVSYAKTLMHGKPARIRMDGDCPIFRTLGPEFTGARYHSLSAVEKKLPDCLRVTARSEDGEVMAVAHREYPIFGLQFHPESILTPQGKVILQNFLSI